MSSDCWHDFQQKICSAVGWHNNLGSVTGVGELKICHKVLLLIFLCNCFFTLSLWYLKSCLVNIKFYVFLHESPNEIQFQNLKGDSLIKPIFIASNHNFFNQSAFAIMLMVLNEFSSIQWTLFLVTRSRDTLFCLQEQVSECSQYFY